MKGIDYVTETNTYRAFSPFFSPIRKIGFCPEQDSKPRLPDYQSGMLSHYTIKATTLATQQINEATQQRGDPQGSIFLHLRVYPCLYNPRHGLEHMKVTNVEATERYRLCYRNKHLSCIFTFQHTHPKNWFFALSGTLLSHLVNLLRCQRGSLDGVVA